MSKGGRKRVQVKYILCLVYVFFAVLGLSLIKYAGNHCENGNFIVPMIGIPVSFYSFAGIVCYSVSFFLYLGVISKFDLGVIIPILTGVMNILVLLVSVIIFKEKLSYNAIAGAAFIIAGIIIMNLKIAA